MSRSDRQRREPDRLRHLCGRVCVEPVGSVLGCLCVALAVAGQGRHRPPGIHPGHRLAGLGAGERDPLQRRLHHRPRRRLRHPSSLATRCSITHRHTPRRHLRSLPRATHGASTPNGPGVTGATRWPRVPSGRRMRTPLTQDDVDDVVRVARQEAVVGNGQGLCRTCRMADLADLRGRPFRRPPDVRTAGVQGPDPTVHGPRSEIPLQELSPPHADGPVLTEVADDAHDQGTRGETGGLRRASWPARWPPQSLLASPA
jgi:hypothetical protein